MSTIASLAALTPVQAQVAELLAAGVSLTDAAAQCGVARQTVYLWRQSSPAFVLAVEQARRAYVEILRDDLRTLSRLALDNLRQILSDDKAPAGVRLRAALAVLKRSQTPKSGWDLPEALPVVDGEPISAPGEEEPASDLHLTKMDTNSQPAIPRGAPCPCGSGLKYKRCCGHNAPPVLSNAA